MKKILFLQGPNLNMLGMREPEIYGRETLADIHSRLAKESEALGLAADFFQSNSEGALVDKIQSCLTDEIHQKSPVQFIIINPGALTHTSVALRDALLAVSVPFVEVHLSNIFARETFRHRSYISDKALAVISGLGSFGYTAALNFAAQKLDNQKHSGK